MPSHSAFLPEPFTGIILQPEYPASMMEINYLSNGTPRNEYEISLVFLIPCILETFLNLFLLIKENVLLGINDYLIPNPNA